ncbi:Transposase DDE domain [Legionella pneumophila]|nr:Transposase DDE domain [Legionella pneumophila]CZH41642.1 Transposase DDE domain [Legionella pneumophila]
MIKIGDEDWVYVKRLYPKATTTPKYLSRATIARANPLNADLYIYKEHSKGRIKKTIQGVKCQSGNSKKYAKGAHEPWIIITSLSKGLNTAKKIIKIYKLRMQIEGAFKDIKNKRYGFRLPESGTKSIERLENLILIALLATVVAWLAGQVAISNKWHYQIQANTVRSIPVLSIMFIGLHILRHLTFYKVSTKQLIQAFSYISNHVLDWGNYDCVKL